jgi:hypothetical protein
LIQAPGYFDSQWLFWADSGHSAALTVYRSVMKLYAGPAGGASRMMTVTSQ